MSNNEHRGRTGDLVEDALDIANALLIRRVLRPFGGPMIDPDEERQRLYLHLLERLPNYDPKRSTISTYVYMIFGQWWGGRRLERVEQAKAEALYDPLPRDSGMQRGDELTGAEELAEVVYAMTAPAAPDHNMSDKAQALIEALPERMREPVTNHLAYGASLTATAELCGVSERTVSRYVATARDIWRSAA